MPRSGREELWPRDRDVAVGQHLVVVLALVEVQPALLHQVIGELADVLRHRITRIEEVPGAGQRVQEAVGDAPGVPALAEDDALDPQLERRLAELLKAPAPQAEEEASGAA